MGNLKRTRSNFGSFMNLVMMMNSRKVLSNTTIVRQGETCNFIYFINYGHFLMLRSIDFIEAMNEPLEQFVNKNATDAQQALIELQKNLPFEDPDKYPCSYSTKLMQISQLSKGKTFGDSNLLCDWPATKLKEDFVSDQKEPYTVLSPEQGEIYYI